LPLLKKSKGWHRLVKSIDQYSSIYLGHGWTPIDIPL
jgi:hypothetical protein